MLIDGVSAQSGQTGEVDISTLRLDRQNPRLAPYDTDDMSEDDLLRTLWREMEANEIALSIASNGWFAHEHLLVVPHEEPPEDDQQYYTVVEGNRRLVAVKVLRDNDLLAELGGEDLTSVLRQGEERRGHGIRGTLPVVHFDDREELWAYVGFEHVNGAKPWNSLSKAEYIWTVRSKYDKSLNEIAEAIGDYRSAVQRLYRGYAVLRQAEDSGVFSRKQVQHPSFYFSHLYTAVGYEQFRDFLGIHDDTDLTPEPVPDTHETQLGELFRWLYGDEDQEPVVKKQNPHLNWLREVVADDNATQRLRRTQNLERAYVTAMGEEEMLAQAIESAASNLEYAQSLLAAVSIPSRSLDDILDQIERSVRIIRRELEDAADGEAPGDGGGTSE